jgi:hypothetical protein
MGIAFDGVNIWVANNADHTLVWINPKVGRENGITVRHMALKLRKLGKESLQRAC